MYISGTTIVLMMTGQMRTTTILIIETMVMIRNHMITITSQLIPATTIGTILTITTTMIMITTTATMIMITMITTTITIQAGVRHTPGIGNSCPIFF